MSLTGSEKQSEVTQFFVLFRSDESFLKPLNKDTMSTSLLHSFPYRVQREQIIAKKQEEENARLKNSGRGSKGSKDGLRPESPHSRRPRRPLVRNMTQSNRAKMEVSVLLRTFFMFLTSQGSPRSKIPFIDFTLMKG